MRFLNQDPIGFEGGMNWFAFVNGDPISSIDPSGLCGAQIAPNTAGPGDIMGNTPHRYDSGGMIYEYDPATGQTIVVGEKGMQDLTGDVATTVVGGKVVGAILGRAFGAIGRLFGRAPTTVAAESITQTVTISSHGMRHFPSAFQSTVSTAIRQDIAAMGNVASGQIVQRTITVTGQQVTYRAFGLANGTVNVGTAFPTAPGAIIRNIAVPPGG
jgi:hypothetical protein